MNDAGTIVVLALGGTIAMSRSGAQEGVRPALTADDLVQEIPGLSDVGVSLRAETFRSVPGASLTLDDLGRLAQRIDSLAVRGVAGVVVTQGTDTLEETAFFLDLTVTAEIPVVVTGAMRNPTLAGADGPANLLSAIRVAASPAAAGWGCVVVMGGEIHAARFVRKTHSFLPAAFTSPGAGPVGCLAESEVMVLTRLPSRPKLPVPRLDPPPAVPVVPTAMGDDLVVLRPVRRDLDGLVVAAFGVGHVPGSVVSLLAEYAERIPVAFASRTGAGAVHRATYGFPGSETDLIRAGLIPAGILDPYKARVLVALLVANGADRDAVSDALATHHLRS